MNTTFLSCDYGFIQLVQQPTHGTNLIDKFFISKPDLYTCTVSGSILKTKHKSVVACPLAAVGSIPISPSLSSNSRSKSTFTVYDTRAHHIDYLRFVVGTFDWSFLFDISDIDVMYCQFVNTVKVLIKKCIPCKTVEIRSTEPYYITPIVKSLLIKRNRLRRRGKLVKADLIASKINSIIAGVRGKHLTGLSKSRPKELWKAVRSCTSQQDSHNSNYKALHNPDEVNSYFAKISTNENYRLEDVISLYSPLSGNDFPSPPSPYILEIFLRKLKNTSAGVDDIPCWFFRSCSYEIVDVVSFIISRTFETGKVPENWRTAIVTPIPKTSNPKSLSEFRPISVTPILSRLTEK